MWKIASIVGWLLVAAGISIFVMCLLLVLNPSPHDFEGMLIGASITVIVVVTLPMIAIGLILVSFAATRTKTPEDA